MRAEVCILVVLAGCTPLATWTRPEGAGGWSPERRRAEIAERAAAAGVSLATAAPSPSPTPVTLADALALARRNRRVGAGEQDLAIAGQRVRQSRARLLPQLTGEGRYTWYSDRLTTGVELPPPLAEMAGGVPEVEIRESSFGTVAGTLTLPLDVFGELTHTLTAAQAGYRGERARLWATTLAEQLDAVRAYFELLEAQRLHDVAEQTLQLQREQLENTEQRFSAGRLRKNELLVVQVALRDSEQRLVQRRLAIDRARWTLNRVLGLAVGAATEVADVHVPPLLPGVDEARESAQEHNPVILALVEEQQRLDDLVRARTAALLPRFHGGGAIDYSSAEIVEPQHVGSGFVGFTWEIDLRGLLRAELEETRRAAERQRLALESELRLVDTAVRSAQRATEERLAALTAAEAAVGQAEENLRIRQQQFGAGRATSEDVLDAESLLASQRATLATALYQAHTRRAELQSLMGLPLEHVAADGR